MRDLMWFKDAIIYELCVRSFHDSNGDGIGDFRGLTQKLDYLQELGITAIQLLPFFPSPLKDDGYDIADFTNIDSVYGDRESFRKFLVEAHSRGLRVITELVINHTSDRHPWFQRARKAPPDSAERNFYVWSESPERFRDLQVIFKYAESSNWAYDNVARAYYLHRYHAHEPVLNFENSEVRREMMKVVDYWLDFGVDGIRLDAVPYHFERDGTDCENLSETHAFLKGLRKHVDSQFSNRVLIADVNHGAEAAAAYFGVGDECQVIFHSAVMPRLFMALHTEDRFPLVDILEQLPSIPENCQWAIHLHSPSDFNLRTVSDEERDYFSRAYETDHRPRNNLGIRRRLAPLLGRNQRRIELMFGLLFSLPGAPIVYYGDEIGMGDNIYLSNRNGVRTPMQWSADRNAGFSKANPQKLCLPINIDPEYHFKTINVEAQQTNPNSLLSWNRRLIWLRQQQRCFSHGTIEFLWPHNRKILAFIRRYQNECALVIANLSRVVQPVELDLAEFAGITPIELFGSTTFPRIDSRPYGLMLGPHVFYWFSICRQLATTASDVPLETLTL